MKTIHLVCTFCFLVYSIDSFSQSLYPGQNSEKLSIPVQVPLKAYSFNLSDIRLLDSPFKDNMERESGWIYSLGNDRLLHNFRVNAGIRTSAKALAGWEALDVELRGHSMGHILSGLALLYASTGEEKYKNKGDSLVVALAEVQKVLNQEGYLSAFPQYFIDRCIAGTGVWAPWYTLHKIFAGLLDMYLYAGNKQALDIAEKMASWAYEKLSLLSSDELDRMLRNEFGGVNEVFYNLYSITGNQQDLKLAEMFYHQRILDPLSQKEDKLKGLHANTLIPKITGEARGYELTANERGKTIATYFWETVIDNHTYVTGGNSDREGFFDPGKISEHLSGYTCESCNTYNMLKLTRHLFTWYADVKYADYYEKALYNHILGQQDPKTGMISYFLPSLPGAHKVYSTGDSSFWCCVGTGFENQAKFGEAIYYHNENGLFVNLFIPSELDWKAKAVKVRQETRFPEDETTTLTIITSKEQNMPIYLRYPSWATSGVTVKINGRTTKISQGPGSYIALSRKWKNGDQIIFSFPMTIRILPTNDNPKKVAIAYGPIVLAAGAGTEGFIKCAPYSNPLLHNDYYTYNYNVPDNIIKTLDVDVNKPETSIKAVAGQKLTFKTVREGLILKPLYSTHRERYVIYWDLK